MKPPTSRFDHGIQVETSTIPYEERLRIQAAYRGLADMEVHL
jgi:hypothetical protein